MGVDLPSLYAIVDAGQAARHGWTVPDLAAAYFDGGARLVQLRAPGAAGGVIDGWCDAVVARASGYGAAVVVNDRADVARMSGAAGVHLGQDDLPVEDARRVVGESAVVGLSTHTADQVGDALARPVTYVAVGPVYATGTKDTGHRPVGLGFVRTAAERAGAVPVVAIGGITLERAPEVIAAGAGAVAVIGDLLAGGRPSARAQAYVDRLSK
ncbi:MAG: thiamine phosphate synthase [Acidobacteria bacterium]|nr:thiamine phosphate synthase [Acidobacteriota bacterium]